MSADLDEMYSGIASDVIPSIRSVRVQGYEMHLVCSIASITQKTEAFSAVVSNR